MKNLKSYVHEAFRVNQDYKPDQYTCQPKNRDELKEILQERLREDKNADLNDIDVSKITNMSQLFVFSDPHNIDISGWDVSNVKNMSMMFYGCENLNCDLSNWNVSNVIQMEHMFDGCKKFTGEGLENWNVSNVEYMGNMFDGCNSLENIPSWYKS